MLSLTLLHPPPPLNDLHLPNQSKNKYKQQKWDQAAGLPWNKNLHGSNKLQWKDKNKWKQESGSSGLPTAEPSVSVAARVPVETGKSEKQSWSTVRQHDWILRMPIQHRLIYITVGQATDRRASGVGWKCTGMMRFLWTSFSWSVAHCLFSNMLHK